MTRREIKQKIKEIGIIPVVRARSSNDAVHATRAIHEGRIACVEITMTVPGAINVIRDLSRELGSEVLIGAGTVLDGGTARECVAAGAEFVVTPALVLDVIQAVQKLGSVIVPGALTPTEVITAWKAGADFVKVFPCGNVGGAKYLKALKAPFPEVEMVPTGGVNLDTAEDFLKGGAAALGVGADLVDPKLMKSGDFTTITERSRQFVAAVARVRSGSNAAATV